MDPHRGIALAAVADCNAETEKTKSMWAALKLEPGSKPSSIEKGDLSSFNLDKLEAAQASLGATRRVGSRHPRHLGSCVMDDTLVKRLVEAECQAALGAHEVSKLRRRALFLEACGEEAIKTKEFLIQLEEAQQIRVRHRDRLRAELLPLNNER